MTTPTMTPIEWQIQDWQRRLESSLPGLPLQRFVEQPETLDATERQIFRGLCKGSLHFATVFALGYDKLSLHDGLHGQMCSRLQHLDRPQMHLMYRGGFKSTIGSIAHPIWLTMNDPQGYSFLLITSDEPLARARMRDVKKRLMRPQVQVLFPELELDPMQKADQRFSVVGREADGYGFEYRTTQMPLAGRHPHHLGFDDLVNEKNYKSREEQDRLKKYFDESGPTVEATNLSTFYATLYANYDTTHHIIDVMYPAGNLDLFVTPVRGSAEVAEDGKIAIHDTEEYAYPVSPECPHEHQWDDEKFDRTKKRYAKHPFIFRAQFMLDTSYTEGQSFEKAWLRWRRRPDLRWFTRYLTVDPASGEATTGKSRPAIVVVGYGENGDIQILETRDHYTGITECVDDVFALFDQFKPFKVGVEIYAGVGNTFWSLLRRQMRERGVWLPLVKQTHGRISKDEHIIEALQYPYQGGAVWHDEALFEGRYESQLLDFPGSEYKDLLDAAAYAVRLALEYGYQGAGRQAGGEGDGPKVVPDFNDRLNERLRQHADRALTGAKKDGYW
jgi:hypothetical protein